MSYVLVLFVGIGLGCLGSWIAHDPAGARQLWADFRKMLGK